MSRCARTDAVLGAAFDAGELSRADAAHVETCPECARATSHVRRFDAELARIGLELAPEALPSFDHVRQGPDVSLAKRPWARYPLLVAGVTVAVGAVLAIRPLGNSALGSWTSVPTSSERVAMADATVDACRERASALMRVSTGDRRPEDPAPHSMEALPLVAHDQRGEASAALFADEAGHSAWICAVYPVDGQPPYVELSGGGDMRPEDFGEIEVWAASAGWNWDYGGRWEIAGRVVDDVGEVTVVREDGRDVVATVDHGWFLAWWPSESEPIAIELRDDDGAVVDTVSLGDSYSMEPSCKVAFLDSICLWR
jgi:hypothetical protein